MITINMKSSCADLDWTTTITPQQAYAIVQLIAPANFPTLQQFMNQYVNTDPDFDDLMNELNND